MTVRLQTPRARVVLVQRRLVNYRVPLFERMREDLNGRGIAFDVLYGDPTEEELKRQDSAELPWARRVACRYLVGGHICLLDVNAFAAQADLLIAPSENRLLPLQLRAALGRRPVALWGHGRNFQAPSQDSPSERLKRWIARRAAWWFAYTETSAHVLRDLGFPESQIVVVNNASDTGEIASHLAGIAPSQHESIRAELGLGGGPVGIAIQSLHRDKRLPLLLDAAEEIRRQVPDFEFVILGDGPERELVRRAEQRSGGWIHWLGPRFGPEKARALALAQVMLNPGMVGLGVLDALVAGVPIVTCRTSRHSPEIDYVCPDVNGLYAPDDPRGYADRVVRLLRDELLCMRLKKGALQTASQLTVENMARRFCDGIERCLASVAATDTGRSAARGASR